MKNKLLIVAIAIVLLTIVIIVIFKLPVHLIKQEAAEISYIDIFDGHNGKEFTIDKEEDVDYIVANISSIALKREGVSIGFLGYGFRMTFYNKNGKIIERFIMNSENAIRKDPFFYRDSTSSLCYNYIKNLETIIEP